MMATLLTNITSSRHRPPSLVPPRKEGWTEIWGCSAPATTNSSSNDDGGDDDANVAPRYVTILNDDCDIIHPVVDHRNSSYRSTSSGSSNASSSSSSSLMILTQHRVAWYEQLVLRMTYQPHSVRNSGYSVMESTGPLPYLLDMSSTTTSTSSSPLPSTNDNDISTQQKENSIDNNDNHPVLIGRNQPGGMGSRFFEQMDNRSKSNNKNNDDSNHHCLVASTNTTFISSGSHIIDYLQSKKCHPTLPPPLPPHSILNGGHVMAYETLIRDRLEYILLALRYGHSPAWTSIYRNQCIRASLDHHTHAHDMTTPSDVPGVKKNGNTTNTRGNGYFFFPLWSWYQTYVERKVAMSNIVPTIYDNTTLSTRGGLTLELFRYNDHRGDDGATTKDDDDDDDTTTTTRTNIHQHHPFSSYLSNYSGSGGGNASGVNVHRAMELADSYYSSLECGALSNNLAFSITPPTAGNQSLEKEVEQQQQQQCTYLFGAIEPTYLDALLFAHLAEAMCDIHLVLVLSKHVKLIKYFDVLYNRYFGNEYITMYKSHVTNENINDDVHWIHHNNSVNATNAFNRLPEISNASNNNSTHIYNDDDTDDNEIVRAIRLMQQMAIHCNNNNARSNYNKDAFTTSLCNNSNMASRKEARGNESMVLQSYRQPTCPNLYRWIMGGELLYTNPAPLRSRGTTSRENVDNANENEDDDASISGDDDKDYKEGRQSSSSPHARKEDEDKKRRKLVTKKMKRDQRLHDELWLSGVGSVLLLVIIISTSRNKS